MATYSDKLKQIVWDSGADWLYRSVCCLLLFLSSSRGRYVRSSSQVSTSTSRHEVNAVHSPDAFLHVRPKIGAMMCNMKNDCSE